MTSTTSTTANGGFAVTPRLVAAASTEKLFDRFDGRVPAELRGELESLRERLVADITFIDCTG